MRWLRSVVVLLAVVTLLAPTVVLHAQPTKTKTEPKKAGDDAKKADDSKPAPRERTQEEKDAAAATTAACCGLPIFAAAIGGFLGLMVYLAPIFIALVRGHPNTAAILVIDLLLGWTLIGWVAALAWSVSAFESAPRYRRPSYDD